MPSRVLLLARHQARGEPLVTLLEEDGFAVDSVTTMNEVLLALSRRQHRASVAVVDVGVGRDAAKQACLALHEGGVPVVIFAGDGVESDLMDFLEWGADDYLPRPERVRELVARVRALHRRAPIPNEDEASDVIQVGDVALDPARHKVTVRGIPVDLPLKQFQLLELFLTNPGRVLTRTTILRRVWGVESTADSNNVEVQVKRLRRHIEDDPADPRRIRTIRGLGYLYATDP